MKARAFSIFLALLILFSLVAPAHADPRDELKENEAKQEEIQSEIDANNEQISDLETQAAAISENIAILEQEVNMYIAEIDQLDMQISQKEEELEELSLSLSIQYTNYYARVRDAEESGTAGYWSMLFSSTSLKQFFNRLACIEEILEYDQNEIDRLEEEEKKLDAIQDNLTDMRAQQSEKMLQLKLAQNTLNKELDALDQRMMIINAENEAATKELEVLIQLATNIRNRLAGATYTGTQDPEEVYQMYIIESGEYLKTQKGCEIVKFALQFVGGRYIWGGSKPSDGGMDCSGFVSYVYKEHGYPMWRVASDQYRNDGVSVERTALQPGDLVFFRSKEETTVQHVGMYIGDDYFVHAANSRSGIIVSDLNSNWYNTYYLGAKRILAEGE